MRGIVTTKGTFDRESKDIYTIPIYVVESSFAAAAVSSGGAATANANTKFNINSQFDVATLVIKITDINDNAPEFHPGSCYKLSIPENSELAVVHTIVASDLDEGPNGDIIYSITGMYIFIFPFFKKKLSHFSLHQCYFIQIFLFVLFYFQAEMLAINFQLTCIQVN